MKFISKNLASSLSFVVLMMVMFSVFVLPVISQAQVIGDPPNPSNNNEGKLINPLGEEGPESIPAFIHSVLENVVKIGIPVVALAVIYSGFLFVAARGKPEAITKAKDALLYTLIGAGLLFGAWAIANIMVDLVKNIE